MGNRLSKEQEQCFKLIQQLFKPAGCLPDKGSLSWEIWEKAGQRSPHNQESLDEKRRGLWDGNGRDSRCLPGPSRGSPQLRRASQLHPVIPAGMPVCACSQRSGVGSLHLGSAATAAEGGVGPSPLPSPPPNALRSNLSPHPVPVWSRPAGSAPGAAVPRGTLPWPAPSSRLRTGADSISRSGVPPRSSLR